MAARAECLTRRSRSSSGSPTISMLECVAYVPPLLKSDSRCWRVSVAKVGALDRALEQSVATQGHGARPRSMHSAPSMSAGRSRKFANCNRQLDVMRK